MVVGLVDDTEHPLAYDAGVLSLHVPHSASEVKVAGIAMYSERLQPT